jgi:hypothetical protein
MRGSPFAISALAAALLAIHCGGTVRGAHAGDAGTEDSAVDSASSSPTPDSGQPPADATAPGDAIESQDVTPIEEPPPSGPAVECPSANGTPAKCPPGQLCCVVGNPANGGNQTDTCQPLGAPCAGTPVRCAVAADCPSGQVCCGTEQDDGGVVSYADASCATSCTPPNQRTFCDQTAAVSSCPASQPTCALSMLLPGYDVCN